MILAKSVFWQEFSDKLEKVLEIDTENEVSIELKGCSYSYKNLLAMNYEVLSEEVIYVSYSAYSRLSIWIYIAV